MKCVICNTLEEFAFVKHGYRINKCPGCKLFHTVLKTTYSKTIDSYYTKAYFTGHQKRAGYANYGEDKEAVKANSAKYLTTINEYKQNGDLLDVGCATGIFLESAQKIGWKGYGTDVSKYAIKIAQKKPNLKIKQGTLNPSSFGDKKFDVITLLDVFEHLDNPRQQLKIIHSLLKPNGILVINTGDSASLLARIEGPGWHYFIPPQHIYFYSRHNLTRILHTQGYQVSKIYHHGKWLSLRYLLHLMRTINKSKIADIMYRLTNKNFFGKLNLYINLHDNMTIIARRK